MRTRWFNIEGVEELKRIVRIKGEKKEALHTTLGRTGQCIIYRFSLTGVRLLVHDDVKIQDLMINPQRIIHEESSIYQVGLMAMVQMGGRFGKPGGGRETRGGGDGLEWPGGQLSMVGCSTRVELWKTHLVMMKDEHRMRIYPFFMYWGLSVIPRMIVNILGSLVQKVILAFSLVIMLIHALTETLLISFDFKTMIEFNYKSRTYGSVKSGKRLEAYSLKEWKHVICFNKGWSDESSFMKETFLQEYVRIPKNLHPFSLAMNSRMTNETIVTAPVNVTGALVTNTEVQPSNAQAVEAWKHSEFLCHNYVLNGLVDSLYNVYCKTTTTKELWESLERKYKNKDAGTKKFMVARFLDYKMDDSKNVITQVQDLQVLLHDIHAKGMTMSETFQVAAIIEKLPPSWNYEIKVPRDFGHRAANCKMPKRVTLRLANIVNDNVNMIAMVSDVVAMISKVNLGEGDVILKMTSKKELKLTNSDKIVLSKNQMYVGKGYALNGFGGVLKFGRESLLILLSISEYSFGVLSNSGKMSTLVFVDPEISTQADGAQSSRVPVPLPKDSYKAIRQAYLLGTDTKSEPFEELVETKTPESPLHYHPLTHTTPALVPSFRRTAHMAVRVPHAMSSSLYAIIVEVASMSNLVFCKRFRSSYDSSPSQTLLFWKRYRGTSEPILDTDSKGDELGDEEVEESSDSGSESEDAKDKGPAAGDEDHTTGDEGLTSGDEGPSMRVKSLGLGRDEAVPEGLQQIAPVVETIVGEPLGLGYEALICREIASREGQVPSVFEVGQGSGSVLEPEGPERVLAFRQPTLTIWIDLEDGRTYINVPVYPPPALPVQSPPSPECSSGSLPNSPAPSILGAQVKMQGGLIHDHLVQLGELSPMLFERSLEHEQERTAMTFGALWRLMHALEAWAGHVDTQMANMSRAGHDDHRLVHDMLVQQAALQHKLQEMI
ncbi:hypothetical protein Tco_0801672 [Tanacetum coccineum]|uniref:Uncharacterized protein n=1 Tax=Tanacetum coccineum TaxID=301880 RepID=A0ABQ4ZWN7_9ASTR